MDSKNDEQTELLRAIGQQLVTVDRTLNSKIDTLDNRLSAFMQQTHENFARVHRNFEKVNLRLEHLELGATRADDLDARLTRVETHVGLRED
jgi:hypothetical protein